MRLNISEVLHSWAARLGWFFLAIGLIALLPAVATAQSPTSRPTAGRVDLSHGVVIESVDRIGDSVDVDVGVALQRALSDVGVTAVRTHVEGLPQLRLSVDVQRDEKVEERDSRPYYYGYGGGNNRIPPIDFSSRSETTHLRVEVALTAEIVGPGGQLWVVTAQGAAKGQGVTYSSTRVGGYEYGGRSRDDEIRRRIESEAVGQACAALAHQLVGERSAPAYAPTTIPTPPFRPTQAEPVPDRPTTSPKEEWTLFRGPLDGQAKANADRWLASGCRAPIRINGVVRGYVLRNLGGGKYLVTFHPSIRLGKGERIEFEIPAP